MTTNNYLDSVSEHVTQCIEELDVLAKRADSSALDSIEYRAVERLLQVLIESCIGFGKQWVKHSGLSVAPEALKNYQLLFTHEKITRAELDLMKAVVGVRNVLVHDYLDVDYETVDEVLKGRLYQQLLTFVNRAKDSW